MADNVTLTTITGSPICATDEATYSGDTTKIQIIRQVHVSGAEGSKTVAEIGGTAGSPGTAALTVQGISGGTAISTSTVPATSGGNSTYHVVAAATTNTANVKASAGQVYGVHVFNNVAYAVFVKLHNTAGVPTAGAGVVRTIGCQAGTRTSCLIPNGMAFATGIGISIVQDITDAGTTALAASDCVVDVDYK